MTQYQIVNLKLSNSQIDKLEPAAKNATNITLRLSSNVVVTNETNFPHRLFLTNKQVLRL